MPQKTPRAVLTLAFALATLAAFTASLPSARAATNWLEPTPEERAAKASAIDPDAGAEVLYRLKQVDDSNINNAVTEEYVRIKIYNENGVSALSKIEIPYNPKTEKIKDLAARVIKPGGSKTELDKKAFYDREVVKDDSTRTRVRMISFSLPAMEPGAIVEYRFRRASKTNIFAVRFDLMGNMPVRNASFQFRPVRFAPGYTTKSFFHLCSPSRQRRAAGFYCYEVNNMKAAVDEPLMPPDDDVRPWMVFYPAESVSRADFWNEVADALAATADACIKKGNTLARDTAAQITRGAAPGRAQAAALNDFCRAQILNIDTDPTPGPPDPKLNTKDPRTPDDVLKTKKARTQEIQILFVALARSLGLDARPVVCSRRSDGKFSPALHMASCMPDNIVAVRLGDQWQFYDPAHREVDTGMLFWDNEGQESLIPDPDGSLWETTPVSPPEKSREKRTAHLQIDGDGALSGDMRIEMTGHGACAARLRYMTETQAAIEGKARDRLRKRLPNAEISDVTASGSADVLKPFVLACKVRVPNYAETSGQRMFVQPGFFTKGEDPMFTAATRAHDICFPYADTEEDEVTIKVPDGYSIEAGSAPESVKQADWGSYTVTLGLKPKSHTLVYTRAFAYSKLQQSAADYDQIKKLFDFLHAQDTHVLTLKKNN